LKPLDLSGPFRARVRDYPKKTRGKIGLALQHLERDFGHPHRHQGLGIRKLTGNFFEIRVGLDIRLVFQNRAECLWFVMAGNHDEVQKFLRGL
jgi:mRNA-degrading endonuclease YafQ of YafQ-DinJ toxin-antitoxin module